MFRRFGPYNLFPLSETKFDFDDTELSSELEADKNRSSKDWKVLRTNLINIKEVANWVFANRKEIISTFPRTAAGEIVKNRHVLIKQYAGNASASAQSLFSRGFEGTNYRLVVCSDMNRALHCRYAEYNNFSGFLLSFRDGFPKASECEICQNNKPKELCLLCGNWYCKDCGMSFDFCKHIVCKTCGTENGPLMSAHEWYYHRQK